MHICFSPFVFLLYTQNILILITNLSHVQRYLQKKIHVWLKCPVKLLSYLLTFDSYCIKTFGCNLVKQFYFTFNFTYNEQSIFKLCAMD